MAEQGISVKETEKGLQLNLNGELYKKIAKDWEQGNFKPFYPRLKEFIKRLKEDYSE
jgi:hypothetical protein